MAQAQKIVLNLSRIVGNTSKLRPPMITSTAATTRTRHSKFVQSRCLSFALERSSDCQGAKQPLLCSSSTALLRRLSHSKSDGDQQFIEFLEQEIATEKKESQDLPNFSGFSISTSGPKVTLTKQIDGELVTVEFNVNDSVHGDEDMAADAEEDNTTPPAMVAQPDFTVILAKQGSKHKLGLRCSLMSQSNILSENLPDDDTDAFEITELAMLEGDWTDSTYSVNVDLLDANMYDMLMLMLEQRGINHKLFCQELEAFSTQYEHDQYISLLESLQGFVKA